MDPTQAGRELLSIIGHLSRISFINRNIYSLFNWLFELFFNVKLFILRTNMFFGINLHTQIEVELQIKFQLQLKKLKSQQIFFHPWSLKFK